MLEHLSIELYYGIIIPYMEDYISSENQFRADNQQERLLSNQENPQRLHARPLIKKRVKI